MGDLTPPPPSAAHFVSQVTLMLKTEQLQVPNLRPSGEPTDLFPAVNLCTP